MAASMITERMQFDYSIQLLIVHHPNSLEIKSQKTVFFKTSIGQKQIVDMLLKYNVDVNVKDLYGESIIFVAAIKGNFKFNGCHIFSVKTFKSNTFS